MSEQIKVWILEYRTLHSEDAYVVGVFSTEERAKTYRKIHAVDRRGLSALYIESHTVDEWVSDDVAPGS